jgi:hypothetical protein
MSARAGRSFEKITRSDLERLASLALGDFGEFFVHNPRHPYVGRLRFICLLQTAAKHYVEPDQGNAKSRRGGVNDFDVCGFFETVPNRHLYPQRKVNFDFGSSKFGRHPEDDEKYQGRRVDVMWRDIRIKPGETPTDAVGRYLRNAAPGSSADFWAAKPVVMLWPKVGQVIWGPLPRLIRR